MPWTSSITIRESIRGCGGALRTRSACGTAGRSPPRADLRSKIVETPYAGRSGSIDGPGYVQYQENRTWTVLVSGGTAPYTYSRTQGRNASLVPRVRRDRPDHRPHRSPVQSFVRRILLRASI